MRAPPGAFALPPSRAEKSNSAPPENALSPGAAGLVLRQLSGVPRHFEADQQFRIGRGAAGARKTRAKAPILGRKSTPFLGQLLAGAPLVIKAYRHVFLDSEVPACSRAPALLDIDGSHAA